MKFLKVKMKLTICEFLNKGCHTTDLGVSKKI